MKMFIFSIIILILKLSLAYRFEIDGPFYLHSKEKYYQTKQSKLSELEIITLNQSLSSNFALEVNSKPIKTFNLTTKSSKYKVLIYHQLLNPYITDLPNEIYLSLLCKFFYPITLTGDGGAYQCSFFYLSSTTQSRRIHLGSCVLNLRATSSQCTIKGTIQTKLLLQTARSSIQLSAEVSTCHNCQQQELPFDGSLQHLAFANLTVELKNSENLIWYESFYNETSKIGLLIGMPRSSINREIGLDLPVKLILPPVFTLPLTLLFRIKRNYIRTAPPLVGTIATKENFTETQINHIRIDNFNNMINLSLFKWFKQ